MKAVAIIVMLAVGGYYGWNFAKERGWLGFTTELKEKKNENFAK